MAIGRIEMKKHLPYILLLLLASLLYAQNEHQTPELLFILNSSQLHFFGYKGENYIGAIAMEYYNKHLYIASADQILKTDLKGNILNEIEYKVKGGFPFGRIKDISFINGNLYALLSNHNLLLLEGDHVKKVFRILFAVFEKEEIYSSNYSFLAFQPEYISNVDDELYFFDNYHSFALNDLTYIDADSVKKSQSIDGFYFNGNNKASKTGIAISKCDYVEWMFLDESYKKLKFKIRNDCENTSRIIAHRILTKEDERRSFILKHFFKNNYVNDYFVFYSISKIDDQERSIEYGVANLDQNFEIIQRVNNLNYYSEISELSPRHQASFTADEEGNIYYCTNKFDWENRDNSIVEIYKIDAVNQQ